MCPPIIFLAISKSDCYTTQHEAAARMKMTIPLAFEVQVAFEVQDRWGRTIRLTEEVWNEHVLGRHEELADQLDAIVETLIAPNMVRFDARRFDGECFYRFGAVPTFPHRYLKVAVRFIAAEGGMGYIHTAHISRKIPPKETLKWQK